MITESGLQIMFALILLVSAIIITKRDIYSLFNYYSFHSLLIAIVPLLIYFATKENSLLLIAALTIVSKVIIIPFFMHKINKNLEGKRDVEFTYLTSNGSLYISMLIIVLVYFFFSKNLSEVYESPVHMIGAAIGVSLAFMGMIMMFSRKKAITKIVGYLVMENGVLLFSLFFTELPFIIEVLITLDLIIIITLSAILALGVNSSLKEFHDSINPFSKKEGDE